MLTLAQSTPVVTRGGQDGDGTGGRREAKAAGRTPRRSSAHRGARTPLPPAWQLVVDVALVGVPDAGQSTCLAAVTRDPPTMAAVRVCRGQEGAMPGPAWR